MLKVMLHIVGWQAIRLVKRQDRRTKHNANIDANILIVLIGQRYASLQYCRKYTDIFPWFDYVGNDHE